LSKTTSLARLGSSYQVSSLALTLNQLVYSSSAVESHCKVDYCSRVGSEHDEASGQIGANDARKDKEEPEEAEAVQSSDGALRRDIT
jgi:glycyl-tRNA synthetase beta subunit